MKAATINKIMNGDSEAFAELYNEYCNKVYSIAYSVVKDEYDSEDIMQEIFISLPEKLKSLNHINQFDSWLFRMTKNKAIDFLRKNKAIVFSEIEGDNEDFSFEDTLENDNRDFKPEENLDYKETKQIIRNIIDSLPEEQRECVLLRFEKGYSLQEIADITGASVPTIKSRLKYGKTKIEEAVKEEEKKGTKLYGVSGFMLIPFLRWLFGNGGSASSALLKVSSLGAAGTASATTSAVGSASTAAAAASAVGSAVKVASASALTKGIIAGVSSAIIAVTATVAVINSNNTGGSNLGSEPALNNSVIISSESEILIPTEGLEYYDLSDGTYGVSAGDAENLKEIVIPSEYQGKAVTEVGWFGDCKNLTKITIPDSVTSIGNRAFDGCTGLTSITIPDSVTSIGTSAFVYCTGLTSITIPDSVTSIGGSAFLGCTGLTSVIISNGVTSIGRSAFEGCTNLTSVAFPDSVTSIGMYAFAGCTGLTSITIPDSVTSIGVDAFDNTKWYNNQPNGLVYAGKVAYEYKGECPSNVEIKNGTLSLGDGAFEDCNSLTSITIPDSVTSIGEMTFYGCTGLTSITIPDSVTSIGNYAFWGCTGLTSITIPDSVTSIDGFTGCTGLTSVTIPNSVTGISASAFCDCTSLTSITIPDSVKYIGESAFYNCTSLTSITIPDSVTSIGHKAFDGCTNLKSITIPDSVTSIGYRVFDNTKWYNNQPNGLVYAGKVAYKYKGNCPSNVEIKDGTVSISQFAFSNCTGLTSVTIPDSVTSIGFNTFEGCTNLTSMTIPDSVTSIGVDAFSNCANPLHVYYSGYKSDVEKITIEEGNEALVWHCIDGDVDNNK